MVQCHMVHKKALLFSFLSLFASMYSHSDLNVVSFTNPSISISANMIFGIFFFIMYYYFYKYVINKVSNYSMLSIVIGFFAGLINVLGRNFMLYNSMKFFSKDVVFAVVLSLLAAIGYGLIYASLFELGWSFLKVPCEQGLKTKKNNTFVNTINCHIFDKHSLLYPFLLICLFWTPYFISFFPGMLQWDAVSALLGYYGIVIWTNHHPVIGTLLMGYIMDIGKYLGNDNYGCTIYVALQFLLLAITLAYNFVFFNKWKTSYIIRWLVLILFLLHPVFPTFVMTEVKDIFYYVAFLWLLYLFINCFEEYDRVLGFYIIITSMFVCVLRKEGLFVCVVCALVLLFFQEFIYKEWKNILNSLMIGTILSTFLSYGALVNYKVVPASITEALSIPLQQTARYIRDYGEDITGPEWEILNIIFENKADKLGRYYKPDISDPVKAQINYSLTKDQMASYFKVWFHCLFRHPGCYFSAAFNQMYGYFYLDKEAMYRIGDCRTENFVKGDSFYSEQFKIVDDPRTINYRKAMVKYIYSWPDIPFLGLLYHPALYTWILLFGLSCLFYLKKYKYLFLYCMPLAVLCICCLSPVNAFIRYSFPIIMSCFILAAFNLRLVS